MHWVNSGACILGKVRRRDGVPANSDGAPNFDIGEDHATNGVRIIGQQIKASQFALKSNELGLSPAVFDDAFPERLQRAGEQNLGASERFGVFEPGSSKHKVGHKKR